MTVNATDLKIYQSGDPNSAGGTSSATEIVNGSLNNLWPDITAAEALAGGSRVRKEFLRNTHATDAYPAFSYWISVEPTSITEEIALGFDNVDDDDTADINMTDWTAAAVMSLESSGSDTRIATIYGINNATGLPESEAKTLTGTTPVLSTKTWSFVYGVYLDSTDPSNTVTIKEGSVGTTRGTIGPNRVMSSNWIDAGSKSAGLKYPGLAAGDEMGIWHRLTWTASTPAVDPNESQVSVEPL